MSKPDWSFLENLLEEGQEYSTGIGRIWLTVLFLFRLLVLGTAAESAWNDEQADFVCNTKQPGCEPVCYDKAFPISHFRYFVLQVIFVSTPTIFYFGYVAIRARREIKVEEVKDEEAGGGSRKVERNNKNVTEDSAEEKKEHDNGGKGIKADKAPPGAPKLKGRLLCAYAFSTLFKAFLEAAFIVGLWILYDGFFIKPKFECEAEPCPHTVDCFVSRPTEKTIFTIYTQVIAAISLLLNVVELLHLVQLALSHHLDKRYRTRHRDYLPWSEQVSAGKRTPEIQTEASQSDKAGSQVNPSVRGQAQRYRNPRESHRDGAIEMNSRPEEDANDLLPSYVNCMGAMRISQPPRDNYKKQAHPTLQNSKGAHKGHSKQKHYV